MSSAAAPFFSVPTLCCPAPFPLGAELCFFSQPSSFLLQCCSCCVFTSFSQSFIQILAFPLAILSKWYSSTNCVISCHHLIISPNNEISPSSISFMTSKLTKFHFRFKMTSSASSTEDDSLTASSDTSPLSSIDSDCSASFTFDPNNNSNVVRIFLSLSFCYFGISTRPYPRARVHYQLSGRKHSPLLQAADFRRKASGSLEEVTANCRHNWLVQLQ